MSGTQRWLVLRLEAPLVAFGGVAIDAIGVTRDFPAASMLTGLLANALGWQRTDRAAHQSLQDRLVFAVRRDRENPAGVLTDTHNVQLGKNDRGWTTWGRPEGRDGASYSAPHRRQRDYHVDACITVVLRLDPADTMPDLAALAAALDRPARPLFIGRKPCLPSGLIQRGEIIAATAYDALCAAPRIELHRTRALWPASEGPQTGDDVARVVALPDLRNWETGLHGGDRLVVEGALTVLP
ncbi:MAG: type I-E CRISPR-associated protein Cas5/CasD [Rhodospirillales bacterium 69-11]|nr:type I-E CRISPR-associated protein Cas5/CasD [Rhodospirillales bacterium]ODU62382.1 MAG: type I-E CRISPR-associated protein Cas5/CasD [Acetobacteraceae bacterium SCN 69-10]OJW19298.1 MAG: type I-E CRISPR-associated protein Cas5/CasD [Rhodospirillales bacterium 69-11]